MIIHICIECKKKFKEPPKADMISKLWCVGCFGAIGRTPNKGGKFITMWDNFTGKKDKIWPVKEGKVHIDKVDKNSFILSRIFDY